MALTTIGEVPQWGGVADWSSCRTETNQYYVTPCFLHTALTLNNHNSKILPNFGEKSSFLRIYLPSFLFWILENGQVKKHFTSNATVSVCILGMAKESTHGSMIPSPFGRELQFGLTFNVWRLFFHVVKTHNCRLRWVFRGDQDFFLVQLFPAVATT